MKIPKDARLQILKADCGNETNKNNCRTCKLIPECNENKYMDGLSKVMPQIIAEIGIDEKVFLANLDLETFDISNGKIMILTFENQVIANVVGEAVHDDADKIIGLKLEAKVKRKMVEHIQRKYKIAPPVRMTEPEKPKQKVYHMPSNATIQ